MQINDFYFMPEQLMIGVEFLDDIINIHFLFFTLEIKKIGGGIKMEKTDLILAVVNSSMVDNLHEAKFKVEEDRENTIQKLENRTKVFCQKCRNIVYIKEGAKKCPRCKEKVAFLDAGFKEYFDEREKELNETFKKLKNNEFY